VQLLAGNPALQAGRRAARRETPHRMRAVLLHVRVSECACICQCVRARVPRTAACEPEIGLLLMAGICHVLSVKAGESRDARIQIPQHAKVKTNAMTWMIMLSSRLLVRIGHGP